MKVLILYRPNSEHRQSVEEFVTSLQGRTKSMQIETVNVDSREGSVTAGLYDVMQYPAVLVVQDNGSLHKIWQGPEVPPLLDEVISYANV